MSETASLNIDGKSIELARPWNFEDEVACDISALRGQTGTITIDPGYGNTGSCKSAVTHLDGEKGILRYRGYPIEQLAEKATFLEVAYLLIYGALPNRDELTQWRRDITNHTLIHEDMRRAVSMHSHRMHTRWRLLHRLSVVCRLSTKTRTWAVTGKLWILPCSA